MSGSPQWWGWHQLDPGWAARIVADAALPRHALVLDVGAGTGALTRPLVTAGARVIAIEAHPGRAGELRRRFGSAIIVVQADASDLRLPRKPFSVVANPPFAITTALLRRLLQPGSRLRSARLVLPDHAVRRWAGAGAPGRCRWEQAFTVRAGSAIPRRAFSPPPPCAARLLVIEPRQ